MKTTTASRRMTIINRRAWQLRKRGMGQSSAMKVAWTEYAAGLLVMFIKKNGKVSVKSGIFAGTNDYGYNLYLDCDKINNNLPGMFGAKPSHIIAA